MFRLKKVVGALTAGALLSVFGYNAAAVHSAQNHALVDRVQASSNPATNDVEKHAKDIQRELRLLVELIRKIRRQSDENAQVQMSQNVQVASDGPDGLLRNILESRSIVANIRVLEESLLEIKLKNPRLSVFIDGVMDDLHSSSELRVAAGLLKGFSGLGNSVVLKELKTV